jgi:hypothetical protein
MPAAAARKQTALPTPAEILELLAAAKAQRLELERKQEQAADQSIVSGDEAEYQVVVSALVANHREIGRLEAALSGAEARTKAEAKAQQLAAQAAMRERFYKNIDRLPPLARKMESKIAEFVQVFREYIEAADEAHVAYPNGPAPGGLGLSNLEIVQQVSAHLYRVGALAPITGRPQFERLPPNIPGAKCPNHLWLAQPELIPAFSVAVEQCVQAARGHLEVQHGQ